MSTSLIFQVCQVCLSRAISRGINLGKMWLLFLHDGLMLKCAVFKQGIQENKIKQQEEKFKKVGERKEQKEGKMWREERERGGGK